MKIDANIKIRKGTSEEWLSSYYILQDGEPGFDSTNNVYKIGNGTSNWSELPSIGGGYKVFTSLENGLVPAPQTVTQKKYLRDDGTWQEAVGKLAGYVGVDNPNINIVGAIGTEETVHITKNGTGKISVRSLSDSVATARIEENSIIITAIGDGNTTIVVNIEEDRDYAPASCDINVNNFVFSSVLNENSWSKISAVSSRDIASTTWAVGDTKSVTIKGNIGVTSFDTTLYTYIIGFDHNSDLEGKGISFGTFKTTASKGIDVCLNDINGTDPKFFDDGVKHFNYVHWGKSNYVSWENSDLRYDILGSTDVPPDNYGSVKTRYTKGYNPTETCTSNPVPDTLMAALEKELRDVLKPITKWTDNYGYWNNSVSDRVTATIDYLPILAEYEVFGTVSKDSIKESTKQKQYSYYGLGNSKIKHNSNATSTTSWWWLRTLCWGSANFLCVYPRGTINDYQPTYTEGLAPVFMV